jgi:hypothetical protein
MIDGRLEGIVLKDRTSTYRDGSLVRWVKVKDRSWYEREAWRFDSRSDAGTPGEPELTRKTAVTRIAAILLAAMLIAGCGSATASAPASGVTSVSSPTPTPTYTASPTATPIPLPTEAPILPLEVVRWSRVGSGYETTIHVELRNPNSTWGIVRGTFALTLLNKSGGIVAVDGESGLPGAACCTLYQVPPGESYWVSSSLAVTPAQLRRVASVEFRVKSGWVDWSEAADVVPRVTVTEIRPRRGPRVTGRLRIDADGVFNVQVFALVEGKGKSFAAIAGLVECVPGRTPTSFDFTILGGAPPEPDLGSELGSVVARTTTIPGIGSVDTPPGC